MGVESELRECILPAGRTGTSSKRAGWFPVLRMVTIGVYGFDGESFLQRLRQADVRLLLDLRQRRGVRGPDYAWANSARLQRALAAADVGYRHVKDLAPTTELRRLQYREDDRRGVGRRNRIALASEYAQRY